MPRHAQISEAIRQRVRSGELPVGSQLPVEAALMEEFGVARGTVRRALRTLNDQGILQTVQGKGSYVRSGRPEPSIGQTLVGLSESLSYSEKRLTTRVVAKREVTAGQVGGLSQKVPTDESLLFLDRIRLLDDMPVARLKNWVRIDLTPHIGDTDFEQTALFHALEATAVAPVTSGRRAFRAVLAEGDVADSLGISTVVPLLFLEQETYLETGAIVEWSHVWMDSEQVSVAVNLTR